MLKALTPSAANDLGHVKTRFDIDYEASQRSIARFFRSQRLKLLPQQFFPPSWLFLLGRPGARRRVL